MAKFNEAMFILAQNEGWKSDNPLDAGGETICGISSRVYPEEVSKMRELPYDQAITIAENIYLRDYWKVIDGDKICSQTIAENIFDCAVNCGVSTALRIVQRACNRLGGKLLVDGRMGLHTLAFLNLYRHYDVLSKTISWYRIQYYFDIVDKKPEQDKLLAGWIRRA